jgi:N-formylglutamate deformylase
MAFIVHVPHASTFIPIEVMDQFLLSPNELAEEAMTSADLYTDILAVAAWPNAQIITAAVSRVVIDVERYSNDSEEIMAKYGRGMIYSYTHNGKLMRKELSTSDRNLLQDKWYDPHWTKLRSVSKDATLIDLHSYPLVPWDVEPNQLLERPQIDLGTDPKLTPDEWVFKLKNHFANHGYSVGLNTPYRGVINAGSKFAVMIEIRRDIVGVPNDKNWNKLKLCLADMPQP